MPSRLSKISKLRGKKKLLRKKQQVALKQHEFKFNFY